MDYKIILTEESSKFFNSMALSPKVGMFRYDIKTKEPIKLYNNPCRKYDKELLMEKDGRFVKNEIVEWMFDILLENLDYLKIAPLKQTLNHWSDDIHKPVFDPETCKDFNPLNIQVN